jgi:protein-disulfide isomerase
MSSRARQKAAARERRLTAEATERRRRARRRAFARLGVISSLALVVVVAAAVAGQRDDDPAAPAPAARAALFEGIRQDGITLGSPKAPVVLTEFADLQCPYCAAFARDVLPPVVDRYVRSGRVRLELQVLTFVGEDSVRAGAMAAAAAHQDRLWSFAHAFYLRQGAENTGYATDDFLRGVGAATPGLDVERAFDERDGAPALGTLETAERAAGAAGADHTPAFYLRRGDRPVRPVEPSVLTAAAFTDALDEALAAR